VREKKGGAPSSFSAFSREKKEGGKTTRLSRRKKREKKEGWLEKENSPTPIPLCREGKEKGGEGSFYCKRGKREGRGNQRKRRKRAITRRFASQGERERRKIRGARADSATTIRNEGEKKIARKGRRFRAACFAGY